MPAELAEFVWPALVLLAAIGVLGMLRVLAAYHEQIIATHDMAREVQRIRAEYHRRLHEQKAQQDALKS